MEGKLFPLIMVVVFFIIMFAIGILSRKLVSSSTDFLLAGREMSLGVNSMGILASGFAGTTIALAPAFVLMFGLYGIIFFILAVCFVGYLLYGLLFAKGIRRSGAYTMPEWLEMRFNAKTRRILTISGFIGIVGITANNCLAMANVLTGFFGISIYITVAIAVITFLCFTYLSGMWGVSLTDFVQAIIGCIGVPLLIIGAITRFGTPAESASVWTEISKADLFHGIHGGALPGLKLVYPSMLTILLSLGVFLVWGGQHYWIRMASARSEKDARNAMIIGCISCTIVTGAIGYIGIVAGANFGDKFTLTGGEMAPAAAYGLVSANFGALLGGFLLVFSLAASLSTAASTLMGAVSIATKDIYPFFINKNATEPQIKRAGKIATIVISAIVWVLAYYPGGVTFLTAFATAWMAPAGLLFAIGFLWRKCTPNAAFSGAVGALVLETLYVLFDLFKIPIAGQPVSTYCHLAVVGLVGAVVPAIVVSLFTEKKYYSLSSWSLDKAAASDDKAITLDEEDKRILSLIRAGYDTMAELMDITGQGGEKVNRVVEKLDEHRYIRRDALGGAGFWGFSATEKGSAALPPLGAEDEALRPKGLTTSDIETLKLVKSSGKSRSSNLVYDNFKDPEEARAVAASIVKLLRREYLNQSGFLKRYIVINEKGERMLAQNA